MPFKAAGYVLTIITFIITILSFGEPVLGADGYRQITINEKVSPYKPDWKLEFTLPLNADYLADNIYLQKENSPEKHEIKLELGKDGKTVRVIPQKMYEPETVYRLYIKPGLQSSPSGKNFVQETVIVFNILPLKPVMQLNITDNQTIKGDKDSYVLLLEGSLDRPCKVEINGTAAHLSRADLKFWLNLNLKPGKNQIEVVAVDDYGQQTVKEINVNYEKEGNQVTGGGGGGASGEQNPVLPQDVKENLQKVSSELNNVLNNLSGLERSIVQIIKSDIDKKITDPSYNHNSNIPKVENLYSSLTEQQKTDLETAIIKNVSMDALVQLADYFGLLNKQEG